MELGKDLEKNKYDLPVSVTFLKEYFFHTDDRILKANLSWSLT